MGKTYTVIYIRVDSGSIHTPLIDRTRLTAQSSFYKRAIQNYVPMPKRQPYILRWSIVPDDVLKMQSILLLNDRRH